jgi:hypothetical protein
MPLKLNVGLAQKIGQPAYSSLSAACYVELELESTLLQSDLEAFQRHVRNAYHACRQAINDELARHQRGSNSVDGSHLPARNGYNHENGDTRNTNGQSVNQSPEHEAHRASQKQLDYATQLAQQIRGLGPLRLESLSDKLFGRPLGELSTLHASSLIDMLKAIKEDRISLEDALDGAAA